MCDVRDARVTGHDLHSHVIIFTRQDIIYHPLYLPAGPDNSCRVRSRLDGLHRREEQHFLDVCSKRVRHKTLLGKSREHVLVESVKNITRRSMPIPHPPVGGRPCSSLEGDRLSAHILAPP